MSRHQVRELNRASGRNKRSCLVLQGRILFAVVSSLTGYLIHQNNTMHQTVDLVRDWSLITWRVGGGGYKTGGGEEREVYPYKKGGGG